MVSTPLTLAALATSAVPGLTVSSARTHTHSGSAAFTSAVLDTDRGQVIVQIPNTTKAEVQQSADILGLSALTTGARNTLPFQVSETLGITRAGESRAVVSTFLSGDSIDAPRIDQEALLIDSLVTAISAVHSLPPSIISNAGLPVRTAEQCRADAFRVLRQAVNTKLLPATIATRWQGALEHDPLWSFEPLVTHGTLEIDRLLVSEEHVVGVLGWDEISVSDPAIDFAWLLASGEATFTEAIRRYRALRSVGAVESLTTRARLYHELELAHWLLHGIEQHEQEIVNDALRMLDTFVDSLPRIGSLLPEHQTLSAVAVETLLQDVPSVEFDQRSETAEYEALDEDRAFRSDFDFDFATESEVPTQAKTSAKPETNSQPEPQDATEYASDPNTQAATPNHSESNSVVSASSQRDSNSANESDDSPRNSTPSAT